MPAQFTRRDVNLALLSAGIAMAEAGYSSPGPAKPTVLFDFAIAGGWHHGLEQVRERLLLGEKLDVRAEFDNPYDNCAVAIYRSGSLKLGYVPRCANTRVAALLAEGRQVQATVTGFLAVERARDIPEHFAFTSFSDGDPRLRLFLAA